MSSKYHDARSMTADIGWRVSRLRIRRGLSQNEVARRTGKHTSFISRVERPEARQGVPKRDTVEAILDAIGATPEERAAVFQVEMPPLKDEEVARQVEVVKAQYEDGDLMVILMDARWTLRYMSRRYRAVLGLTDAEHRELQGTCVLLTLIDPESPLYSRYPDDERMRSFSIRAASFQLLLAEHQFDSWYLDLERKITRFPKAEQVWHSLPEKPQFADHHLITVCNPDGTLLKVSVQLRQIYDAPNFILLEVQPADEQTASAFERLAPPRSGRKRT